MIKGVNRQVVEVSESDCEFFERVLFFVKPEFANVSEGKLKERAHRIASGAGLPPPTKIKRNKLMLALKLCAAALGGAGICAVLFLAFG